MLLFCRFLNRSIYINDESHKNINDHIGRHHHEREEEDISLVSISYGEVELVEYELPIIKQHHREEGDQATGVIVEVQPDIIKAYLSIRV